MSCVYSLPSALDELNLSDVSRDIAAIPQADRVKLAILLVRDIDRDECIAPLNRLASQAGALGSMLLRERFERECG